MPFELARQFVFNVLYLQFELLTMAIYLFRLKGIDSDIFIILSVPII